MRKNFCSLHKLSCSSVRQTFSFVRYRNWPWQTSCINNFLFLVNHEKQRKTFFHCEPNETFKEKEKLKFDARAVDLDKRVVTRWIAILGEELKLLDHLVFLLLDFDDIDELSNRKNSKMLN